MTRPARAARPLLLLAGMLAGSFALLATTPVARSQPAPSPEPAAPAPVAAAEPDAPTVARYGFALRLPRYVSVPGWLLGLFTEENVPLHSFGSVGVEFIRRTDFDIVFGLGYQNMSTDDGNWLGRSKDPTFETDLVQFRDLSLIAADVTFVRRWMMNPYFGIHYRAGLGVAIVRGKILRTSNFGCTAANAGDESACRPMFCPPSGCTEESLRASEGRVDGGPDAPSRFEEGNVPGALPIINLALGLDLRMPQWKGFEARLEAGFYDALFIGTAFGYVF